MVIPITLNIRVSLRLEQRGQITKEEREIVTFELLYSERALVIVRPWLSVPSIMRLR